MPESKSSAAEHLVYRSSDGVESGLWISDPLDDSNPIVLMVPAMGVRSRFYQRLAAPLKTAGALLATMELRGHGTSQIRPSRAVDFGYRHIVEFDMPAAIATLRDRWPDRPIYLMGHSLGGQLSTLYAASNPGTVDGLVAVASATVYWKAYQPGGFRLLCGTQTAHLVAKLLGYFPGKRLGFAGLEARTVIRDWAYQSRTGDYVPLGSDVEYERALAAYAGRSLIVSIAGDPYAPRRGVDHLASKIPTATVDRVHLEDARLRALKRTHFDWVNEPGAIMEHVSRWLRAKPSRK